MFPPPPHAEFHDFLGIRAEMAFRQHALHEAADTMPTSASANVSRDSAIGVTATPAFVATHASPRFEKTSPDKFLWVRCPPTLATKTNGHSREAVDPHRKKARAQA